MMRADKTEVLVVGAGPVGLMTALLLSEAGIEFKIIDEEWRTAAHSYACALHPFTLQVLDRIGLASEALKLGHRIETIALYEGELKRAEIRLAELPVEFPFVLVLPQNAFESFLEQKLKQKSGLKVDWNHRLSSLLPAEDTVMAAIDKMGGTSLGYIVPHWEQIVERTTQMKAAFVAGADGHNSFVRRWLGIEFERLAHPEVFMVYEFETDQPSDDELRIVLDQAATHVLWPLPGRRWRWSFQVSNSDNTGEFPAKERRAVWIEEAGADEKMAEHLEKMVQKRAPWFVGNIKEFDWSVFVKFERRLAQRFGQGRCWLAGDSAHQTGPVGMQSMNMGLREAAALVAALKKVLRENGSLDLLQTYDRECRVEWQQLLGLQGGLKPKATANPWMTEHAARILSCLPASGADLRQLANQLALEVE